MGRALHADLTSKGAPVENRALIEDVEGKTKRRYHPDKRRIDESWHGGTLPDIRSEVAYFQDTPRATAHASSVQVIRDDAGASILRLERESGRTEWVAFNPQTVCIQAAGIETTAPLAYIDSGRS